MQHARTSIPKLQPGANARMRLGFWLGMVLSGSCLRLLSACEEPDTDRTVPSLIVDSPTDGATYTTGDTVLLRFRVADETQLATWVINVRNERIGNSVYGSSGNTPNLEPDSFLTVVDRFVVETGQATEFLVEYEAIDAEQNETIEKRSFFEQP